MSPSVLFVHGAGEDAYATTQPWVTTLQATLGAAYKVIYPPMPTPGNPCYAAWKQHITHTLATLEGAVIVIGHSLGGSVLSKYVSEEPIEQHLVGLFTLAAPFWGTDDWQVEEYTLSQDTVMRRPTNIPIFCYHNRNDAIVPFAHLALYAARFPQATIRALDGQDHDFADSMAEIAEDIMNLSNYTNNTELL